MRRASRALLAAACLVVAGTASAQLFQNQDWVESPVPPAPAYNAERLIPIEMPIYLSLKFGVDPETIVITGDGVVRYVVVASNKAGGATNAFYEGVRCATGEMKTYARSNDSKGTWEVADKPDWKPFRLQSSTHTYAIATQAVCRGSAPRDSVRDMVSRLRSPIREVE